MIVLMDVQGYSRVKVLEGQDWILKHRVVNNLSYGRHAITSLLLLDSFVKGDIVGYRHQLH